MTAKRKPTDGTQSMIGKFIEHWKANSYFMRIKSAEGRRSRLSSTLTPEERERQRKIFEDAGIKRIRGIRDWIERGP